MLQLSTSLLKRSVISLRIGSSVATVLSPIINPNNLKIEGFYCEDKFSKQTLVLLHQDIRDLVPGGFVVDDHSVLTEAKDLIRLKDILDLNFTLIGKQVVTVDKEKVGKVNDYATEVASMYIQKLYVARSILKSLSNGTLSIDRSQINEITPNHIIINELLNKSPAVAIVAA
jgi:sporulation protein YlmC with PRC-barrel domain